MKINLKPTITNGQTHQDRLDAARRLSALIVEKHSDAIAAVVIAGSTAVNCDGPYSDLDMTVVTYPNISDQTKCYTCNGLTINLDYQTMEESIEEANEPYVGGCWRDVLSIYDPHDVVAQLAHK